MDSYENEYDEPYALLVTVKYKKKKTIYGTINNTCNDKQFYSISYE